METLNTKINDVIELQFSLQLMRVLESTGSLHTKDDIRSLLGILKNDVMNTIASVINAHPVETNVNQQSLNIANVIDILEHINFDNYAEVDTDSAEFSLRYNNVVELDCCECKFDADTFIDDIKCELENLITANQTTEDETNN